MGLKAMELAKGLSEREDVGLAFLLSSKGAALIKSTPGTNSSHALPPGYPDAIVCWAHGANNELSSSLQADSFLPSPHLCKPMLAQQSPLCLPLSLLLNEFPHQSQGLVRTVAYPFLL